MTSRFLIRGRVQGVGFRWFVSRQAHRLGVAGYARNLDDGSVEVVAQAEDPATLSQLEAALRTGPDHAWVEAVEREEQAETSPVTTRSFEIR